MVRMTRRSRPMSSAASPASAVSPKGATATADRPAGFPSQASPRTAGSSSSPKREQDRFRRRSRARRWRTIRRLLLALAVVAVVALGIWLVFFSSVLAVTGAQVRGTDVLSSSEVRAAAEVPRGVPLATVDLAAIKARVEDLAPVRSADVSRSWPHSVLITVDERTAVAFVVRDGTFRGVDESGVLFRRYPGRPAGLPEIQMQPTTPVDALTEGAAVVAAMPSQLVSRVDHVDVQTIDNITLHLKSGATVTWGSADQSSDKAKVLAVLLAQKATTYDVTAPGHPTIKR